jgi:hypothetical protein
MVRIVRAKWLFVRPVPITVIVGTGYDITDVETIKIREIISRPQQPVSEKFEENIGKLFGVSINTTIFVPSNNLNHSVMKAIKTVYRNYKWRKGAGNHFELYKSVSETERTGLGRSESSTLVIKAGEEVPSSWAHNSLEYRLATGRI